MLTVNPMRAIPYPKFEVGSSVIYKPIGSKKTVETKVLDYLYSKARGYLYLLDIPGHGDEDLIPEAHLKPID